jgi:hypothetical protein
MHEYLFDVKFSAKVSVKADSFLEARQMLNAKFQEANCNGGAWDDENPILFEATIIPEDGFNLKKIDNTSCAEEGGEHHSSAPRFQVIEVPHQYPANLAAFYSIAEVLEAAYHMADHKGQTRTFTEENVDEAFSYIYHDFNSAIILDTHGEDYLRSWQAIYNNCLSRHQHQWAKVMTLLEQALEDVFE